MVDRETPSSTKSLDIIWAGTIIDGVRSELVRASTVIRAIHMLDYDMVLQTRAEPRGLLNTAVFLDSMGPLHPDATTLSRDSSSTMLDYSRMVCGFLDRVEAESGLTTVIAAHPRAEVGVLEPWYGGRSVVYRASAALVAQSRLVLAAEGTTSIGFAVALEKPLSLVTSTLLALETQLYLRVFAANLKVNLFDGDGQGNWSFPEVNRHAYSKYEHEFIKAPGTPEVPFWSVVLSDLRLRP